MRGEIPPMEILGAATTATSHTNITTMVGRIAVAKLESTVSNPTFARTAVMPAKKAESSAHPNQFNETMQQS